MSDSSSNELVMYLLVRMDLKMSKGKMVAQCGHAVEDLIRKCPVAIYHQYKLHDHPKITLKINDLVEMEFIMETCRQTNIPYHQVVDAGRTQLEPDTPTVLGIGPVEKDKMNKIVGNLKLL